MALCLLSSIFLFSFFYLIVTTMGGGFEPDRFCGSLQEVPMSPQISITFGEEKISIKLNGHYISLWKFQHFLIDFFFLMQSNCYLVLSIKNL